LANESALLRLRGGLQRGDSILPTLFPDALGLALLVNVAYFVCMSAAHWTSFKIPILFIYYDVGSNAYQDKIISFCALTYGILFYAAYSHRAVVPYAIASLAATTAGLAAINSSGDLKKSLPPGAPLMAYWIQTCMIAAITGTLWILYLSTK
jgi:hypothetical protein